jgi:hypothetical protein
MINSRNKGACGEREYAEVLRRAGFPEARRDGQQGFGGSHEDPDIRGVPGWHVEVKRTETGGAKAYEWLGQSIRDAGTSGRRPYVAHRRNRSDWIVILRADDFHNLLKDHGELLAEQELEYGHR